MLAIFVLYVTLWGTPSQLTYPKTLPTLPHAILAHCKAHKTQNQSQPSKELKMPTHSPTPADGMLLSYIKYHQQKAIY
jgi:hypothetical protein